MNIIEELFSLQDVSYGDFQARLTPGIPREEIIGVRVPEIRKLADRIGKEQETAEFLEALPHRYYDENMLHGVLLSEMRDFDTCIAAVDRFLPYVDNWAVCDIMAPKVFKKNKPALLDKTQQWSASEKTYTCRFSLETLMRHFLDGDFRSEYLEIPAGIHSDEYYVRMMIAWFFATALAKQWEAAVPYIESRRLVPWVHNKTIQKARESYRITPEQKEYLKTLKV